MNRWTRIRRILALTCAEAAELSSRRMDERLAWSERLAWAGHLLVCRSCRRFRRQLEFLCAATRRLSESVDEAAGAADRLSTDGRARIANAIREAGE